MKKSIYHYFGFNMYRYAPESFNLTFRGKLINVSERNKQKYNFGYILATKGNDELIKVIKKYIRNETIFNKKTDLFHLCISVKNSSRYLTVNYPVPQYNIQEKLKCFKMIRKAQNPIKITTAELDGAGNVINKKDGDDDIVLGNRVCLI